MSEPVDTSAEAVRIIGYRHEILGPGRQPLLMFSETPANPWSHWLAKHLAKCQYTCVPLVVAYSLISAQQRIAELEALLAERNKQNAMAFAENDRLREELRGLELVEGRDELRAAGELFE